MVMNLPPYAAAEWAALSQHPYQAWTQVDNGTGFRRDMLPYADRDDDAFRIVVPVSGGLDSGTCYQMAAAAGLPVEPVMVDTGVHYVRHDRKAAEHLTGGRLHILDLPDLPAWTVVSDVQIGRNSVIMWRLLDWMAEHGWWGEIWFGGLGGNYLETPIVGGDKSFRWLSAMQQLAAAAGYDARIASPLGGMSKSDLVTWWAGRGGIQPALALRSCFADIPEQCGHCWACLYRYVAFAARGYRDPVEATYPHGIDFTDAAREVWRRIATFHTVTVAEPRLGEVRSVLESLGLGPGRFPQFGESP